MVSVVVWLNELFPNVMLFSLFIEESVRLVIDEKDEWPMDTSTSSPNCDKSTVIGPLNE